MPQESSPSNLDLSPAPDISRLASASSRLRRNAGRLAATGLAIIAGTLPAVAVKEGLDAEPAAAATLGYPDYDMPCEHYPYGESGYCADYDWGPAHTEAYSDPSELSARGYAYRNCTDYVAWKESTLGAQVPHDLGNAGAWYVNAPALERSLTPGAGDAAIVPGTAANPYGHVAFVESVNSDGTITVSEYNHDARGDGDTRTGSPAAMGFTGFVDFGAGPVGTKAPSPPASPAEAPDIAYNPANGLPAIAEAGPDGELQYHYQRSDGSWGVARLGSADSAPSIAYNPGNRLPVITVGGSGHSLEYYYQKSDGGWGAARLGEADSAPDVAYNPGNDLPVVAVQSAGHALLYYYQKSDGAWGHAFLGRIDSAPSVAYNPGNDLPVVAAEGPGGTLDYHYEKSNGAWGVAHLGHVTSRPDVEYNPFNHLPVITAQGAGKVLEYYYQRYNGSWGEVNLGEADSDPRLAYNPRNGLPAVAVRAGNSLRYHYERADGSWRWADLGAAAAGPAIAYNPSNGLPVTVAETSGGALGYHYQKSDGGWGSAGL